MILSIFRAKCTSVGLSFSQSCYTPVSCQSCVAHVFNHWIIKHAWAYSALLLFHSKNLANMSSHVFACTFIRVWSVFGVVCILMSQVTEIRSNCYIIHGISINVLNHACTWVTLMNKIIFPLELLVNCNWHFTFIGIFCGTMSLVTTILFMLRLAAHLIR